MYVDTLKRKILIVICLSYCFSLAGQGFTDVILFDGATIIHDGDNPGLLGDDLGTGAAWIDINNDDYLDLYITMRDGPNLLYKNLGPDADGNITWDEIASTAGVQDASNDGCGVVVGDFNNDGFDDLFLANNFEDVLFKNNGDETFNDITSGSGLTETGDSKGQSASWGDYDDDGYLDLYISHHNFLPGSSDASTQDYLFHNNGDETFTDVSALLGIDDLMGKGFIGGWVDFDNDGDLDIILVNDCKPSDPVNSYTRVFRNDSHTSTDWANWTFTEVSVSIGVEDCRNGMGIAIGDHNRDGWLDFFYTNIGDCVLFENDGDGTFTDVAASAGIDTQNPLHFSWGCAFFDYNLDGYQDIIVALGSLNNNSGTDPWPNQLFKNNGDNTFTDVAGDSGVNMDDNSKTRSTIYGDYDNDGDLDVFVMNYGEQCILKRNEHINDDNTGNNWLQVKLIGDPSQNSNKNAIGARLKLTYGSSDEVQYFEIRSGSNLGGGDDLRAHFGLGSETTISELEITWPNGDVQSESGISINQLIEVEQTSPLPLDLINFEARPTKTEVILEWSTAREIENDHFVIQRSWDGFTYENLGIAFGNGTTESISRYSFIDEVPMTGENYYRLKQVDFDGKSSFSPVRLVLFPNPEPVLEIAPNPVARNTQLNVGFNTPDKKASLELIDIFGQVIYQEDITHDGFVASRSISTKGLPGGIYILRLSGATNQQAKKVLIK